MFPIPRLLHPAAAFAIVTTVYGVYALTVVPLIEPPVAPLRGEQITDAQREQVRRRLDDRVKRFEKYFPPGSWALRTPKIVESKQGKLLFQEYQNLDAPVYSPAAAAKRYQVRLRPLAMVFTPDASADEPSAAEGQAIVLEAVNGAVLEFDEPLDLRRVQVGRLIGGKLLGPISIWSRGKSPGPEDDLSVVARQDVELTEQYVRAAGAVDFSFGPHRGRGHEMLIKLLPGEETGGGHHGPNVGGIDSFELGRVERLYLSLDAPKLAPKLAPDRGSLAAGAATGRPTTAGSAGPASPIPVEVTCRGPFRFDALRRVATFKDTVNVRRNDPGGPSDQINCEELSIFFADRAPAPAKGSKQDPTGSKPAMAGAFDLQPQRLVASGNPVIVAAPSEDLQVRGQTLEYDLPTDRITLEGSDEVILQRAGNEIHARRIDYRSRGPGRLGQIVAEGPGWLRGQMEDRPESRIEARWGGLLQVRPFEQNQVISLSGGAQLKFAGIGQLDAPEVHLYLVESAQANNPARFDLRPDRMLACLTDQMLAGGGVGNSNSLAAAESVLVQSPQFSAAVSRLELWFDGVEKTAAAGGSSSPMGDWRAATPAAANQPHFEVVGRLLRARMSAQAGAAAELSELTIEDGVRFVETQTEQSDQRPLSIRGDRLHAMNVTRPNGSVTVTGRPARFEARGLAMSGSNINLNRGTNRLWIDGAGRMDLPLDRDLEGRPLSTPMTLSVEWQDRMVFDGRTARFEESVVASGPQQRLLTETLEVQFQQPIDFSAQQIAVAQRPKVEQILCRGGVRMESETIENEATVSHEQMQVPDLGINLNSGALTAGGPGWLSSVRPADSLVSQLRPGVRLASRPASADASGLRCLHVRFQGSISGNVLDPNRQMTFHDRVNVAYAPVDTFNATLDPSNPDSLGPDGVVMHCDQLSVHEMDTRIGKRGALELEAIGNTVVEGMAFTARAVRLTYAEAKDMLVLEGDGRTDAELYRQKQVGGQTSKATARKILFWPKSDQIHVEGARSVELNQFSTGAR